MSPQLTEHPGQVAREQQDGAASRGWAWSGSGHGLVASPLVTAGTCSWRAAGRCPALMGAAHPTPGRTWGRSFCTHRPPGSGPRRRPSGLGWRSVLSSPRPHSRRTAVRARPSPQLPLQLRPRSWFQEAGLQHMASKRRGWGTIFVRGESLNAASVGAPPPHPSPGLGRPSPWDVPAFISPAFAHVFPQSLGAPRAGEEDRGLRAGQGSAQAAGVPPHLLGPRRPPGVLCAGNLPRAASGKSSPGRNWIWWFSPVWNGIADGGVCKSKHARVDPGGPPSSSSAGLTESAAIPQASEKC